MKLTRMRTAVTAGVLATAGAAAAVALAVAPASAGTAGTTAAAASKVVVVNACTGAGQVRPGGYAPGCQKSQEFFTGLKWVSWKSAAYGSGTLKVNNCSPSSSCGPSKFTKYPVLTVLWRAEARPGHPGQKYFSRLTFIFTGKRPHGAAAQTMVLPPAAP
jgi:hypothetical protein